MILKLLVLSMLSCANQLLALDYWQKTKANYLYQKKDYDHAAKACEQALLANPNNLSNQVNMGKILYQQAKYAQAASYFNKVLTQAKDQLTKTQQIELLAHLGHSYAQQEQWEQALKAYEQLLELDPENVQAKKNIEIIKKILEQQKQQQEQQNQDKQDQKEQQDKQDQESNQDNQAQKDNQADKQSQKNNQDKQDNNSSGQSKQNQQKKDQQAQIEQQLNEKLTKQEKDYLAAIAQNDQKANAYQAKKQAKLLKGDANNGAHNW